MTGLIRVFLSQDGVGWAEPEPDKPWTNIGYWGDHQIIYLLKLLESSHRYHPGSLEKLLRRPIFSYANVPYRFKPYPQIFDDRWNTVFFDYEASRQVEKREADTGTDGKLLFGHDGQIVHVNLTEKILVPALAKLSNLVLDAGIWMNSQKPEWNDANNAIVGNGISMVTHCYLRRYVRFVLGLLERETAKDIPISAEVVEWAGKLLAVFQKNYGLMQNSKITGKERKAMLDELGVAFSEYREQVYEQGLSGEKICGLNEIVELLKLALEYLDFGIKANRRDDGLYHTYNLLDVSTDNTEVHIKRMYEMLEGQVAVLSLGVIPANEVVELLSSLFASQMYREDQKSFMLYPERKLPGFLDRNVVPSEDVESNPLLDELVKSGNRTVVARDAFGVYRFHADIRNSKDVQDRLDCLAEDEKWATLVARHKSEVSATFEKVFRHQEYTGRSGTMYSYEGLGCIYWHMVSKLLLAVQECFLQAVRNGESSDIVEELAKFYCRVRYGLGFNKTTFEYGAFPTDPYSHTPMHSGAQQPGMTGQVKEEILTYFGELGVIVEGGEITFAPHLLSQDDFLATEEKWDFYSVDGEARSLQLAPGMLGFTFCQVPIVYKLTEDIASLTIMRRDGSQTDVSGQVLGASDSSEVFERSGQIRQIVVAIPKTSV